MRAIHMESKWVEAQSKHKPSFYFEKHSVFETAYHYEIESLEILFCTWYQFYTRKVKILGWGCLFLCLCV